MDRQGTTTDQPRPAPADAVDAVDGRRLHYGEFYGLRDLPDDDRPLVTVVGNCQAESLRVLLAASGQVRAVRVPPVFELDADDTALLNALLGHTDLLVTQPVRDDYRGLPLGTAQLARAVPATARTVLVPAFRYAGLYPWQAVVRSVHGDPPVVPYLDLRTVVEAATGRRPTAAPAEGIRAVARASLATLTERERRHDTVVASDLVVPAGADAAHAVNHPGNTVLIGTARRVQERAGLPVDATDPGRILLREVFAPLEEQVVDALGLDAGAVRPTWTVRGEPLDPEAVRQVHLEWLAERPDVVDATLERHAPTLQALGLA